MRESDSLERLNAHGVTEIPDGWHVSKVKYLADYINGYPFKPDEWGAVGKPIIRIQNLTNRDAEPNRYDGEVGDGWAVKSGDFLIAWSASLGLHVWHGEPAWLNQHIFRVDLDESKCTRPFFRWLATWFMEELSRDAHGSTMQHLTKDAFGGFPVLLPSLRWQVQIADFLDRAIAKVDALITAKQNMLSLLLEKRRTLVTHAVTKGLDQNGRQLHSAISWREQIPANWSVLPLRRLIQSLGQGWSPIASNLPADIEEYGVLKLSAIKGGRFISEENKALARDTVIPTELVICKDDIFITRANTPKLVGDVAVAERDYPNLIFSDLIYRVRADSAKVYPNWLALAIRSDIGRNQIEAEAKGSSVTMVKLAQDQVLSILIPVPPKGEQLAIAIYVQTETTKIDDLSRATERTITLLQERRLELISAAVTGRLEINGAFE